MGYKQLSEGSIYVAADTSGSSHINLAAPGGAGARISSIPAQDNAAIWKDTLRYNVLYEAGGSFHGHAVDSDPGAGSARPQIMPDDDAIFAVLRVLRWTGTGSTAKTDVSPAVNRGIVASALNSIIDPLRLSSGEKQRILLTRALLSGKSVLVMDEGTSALSPDVEADAWALLRRSFSSIVLVSHQLRDIQRADYLVGMQDGTVQEAGTPASLLAMKHSLLRHCFRFADGGLSSRLVIRT
jgi:hypothetical protein